MPEDPNAEAPGVNEMIERDRGSWEQRLKEEASRKGVSYDPSDLEGVIRHVSYASNVGKDPGEFINQAVARYDQRATNTPGPSGAPSGGGGSTGSSSNGGDTNPDGMSSWTGQPSQPAGPDPYQQAAIEAIQRQSALMQQMIAKQEASDKIRQERADGLYNTLLQRSQQSLNVNADDPIIRAQVDPMRAQLERSKRNFISDAAENYGPLANLRGEERIANERVGQNVSSFQSELLGRELTNRRQEVAGALASMGDMLSGSQQAALQRELAMLDQGIRQQQVGLSSGQLGLGYADLNLRGELGRGGLQNDLLRTMLQNQQFYGDLGLRNRTQDDYYNLVSGGRLGNQI